MIILFDLDSTLTDIEGFDEIARQKGMYEPIAEITKRTMDGEIPFTEAFATKLKMLAPTMDELEWLVGEYKKHLVSGVKSTLEILSQYPNTRIGLLSNNLEIAVKQFGRYLGLEDELCIGTKAFFDEFDNYLMLDTEDPLTRTGGKGEIIQSIKQKYNDKIIFIGDSMADMVAGEKADLFIAYCGVVSRPRVVEESYLIANNMEEVVETIDKYLEIKSQEKS